MLERLQNGESISLDEFTNKYDPVTRKIVECGGLFNFASKLGNKEISLPPIDTTSRPMTMAEKIIARNLVDQEKSTYVPRSNYMVRRFPSIGFQNYMY